MKNKVRCLVQRKALLGEGPVWDSGRKRLFYVDITGKELLSYDPKTGKVTVQKTEGMPGCIVPDEFGNLIAAEKDTLVRVNPDTGERRFLHKLSFPDYLRYNDGKCDAAGRLWVGTMAVDQGHPHARAGGAFYRIVDGEREKTALDGMTIPNGIAFGAQNNILYHIDTQTQKIDRYSFDLKNGELSQKQTVVTIPEAEGAPDGMTIDEEGMLWVALWGGWQVARYDPETGEKLCSIPVEARNVSCCAFGGEAFDELFITTAQDEQGRGGELYAVKPGVRGSAPYVYRYQNGGIV